MISSARLGSRGSWSRRSSFSTFAATASKAAGAPRKASTPFRKRKTSSTPLYASARAGSGGSIRTPRPRSYRMTTSNGWNMVPVRKSVSETKASLPLPSGAGTRSKTLP